ncbi:DEAD/DEAH box helicase [Microbacterium halophytorum]|uniref:DEAD/DEAH box helicase n=1 Tax=Microbacterium halophytorum TaxID=2067568 RepID=UPI000CFC38CD|nr:DEAD/DEAH box helicase [Microbacterium halophytorum]
MTRISLTDDLVESLFADDDAGDGRALAARVPVRVLKAETGQDISIAHVSVGALSVAVELASDGSIQPWCAHCGVTPCAHVAAAMFALADRSEPFGVGGVSRSAAPRQASSPRERAEGAPGVGSTFPVGEPAAAPVREQPQGGWRGALREALGTVSDDAEDSGEIGLLLTVQETRRGGQRDVAVAARPAVRGVSGAWVRGEVTWHDVAASGSTDARWRALADIEALFAGRDNFPAAVTRIQPSTTWERHSAPWGSPEWMRLDAVPSHGLRELLEAAVGAGLPLIADARPQAAVPFGGPVEAVIDIRAVDDGLVVEARFGGGDTWSGADVLPIGAPTVAVARLGEASAHVVGVAPLTSPTTSEFDTLQRQGRLSIPATDIGAFVEDFLPRLRGAAPLESSDGSFEIPEPAPPELVLAIRHSSDIVRLFWEWEYPPGQRRHPAAERELLDDIEFAAGRWAQLLGRRPDDRAFPARDLGRDETVEFMAHVLPLLRGVDGLRIEAHDELPRYEFAADAPEISFGVDPDGRDWLELRIVVTVQGEPVSSGDLLTALSRGQNYLRLLSGTVFPLTDPRFAKLRDVLTEARALTDRPSGTYRVPRLDADLWQELAEVGVISTQQRSWLDAMRSLGSGGIERRDPPGGFHAELRDYQAEGYSWLDFLRRHRLGGVLADDMGLGKTVQMLAALERARVDEPGSRFLVVAPTSVVGHWTREAARFAPGLGAVGVAETARKRGTGLADAVGGASLVVTSYAVFRLDHEEFARMGFRVLVLDEAQNVKNSASKGYALARALDAPTKFVVTGTPLENNVMELFALATLAAPGLFGTREHFREHFHRAISRGSSKRVAELRARIRPFLLRRTKEEVAPELPPKTEQVLEIDLSPAHRRAYDRRFRREQQKLLGLLDDVKKHQVQILATLTTLRRHALDPSLGDGDPDAASAKLDALGELLEEITEDGHRVLVFSQFTDFLGLAARTADERGIRYAYLDGATPARRRQAMVDRFSSGEVPAFFISLKAGGTGLNLTAADYCIILDPWWNPAAEAQAIDRAHRIGQHKPVMVYRMIAAGTIEQKVRELQDAKRRLFDDVLDGTAAATGLTADDYRALVV